MPIIVSTPEELGRVVEEAVGRAMGRALGQIASPPSLEWADGRRAQAVLGISASTLKRLRRGKLIPYARFGRTVRYKLADLNAFLERQRGA